MKIKKTQHFLASLFFLALLSFSAVDVSAQSCEGTISGKTYNGDCESGGDSCTSSEISTRPHVNQCDAVFGYNCCISKSIVPCGTQGGTFCSSGTCQSGQCTGNAGGGALPIVGGGNTSGGFGSTGGGVNSGTSGNSGNNGACENGYEKRAGVCFPTNTGLSSAKVKDILINLAQWMFSVIGIVATGMIAVCGAKYLLAGGNDDTIKSAKRCITWAIVGIIVALSGLVIIYAVNGILLATPNAI